MEAPVKRKRLCSICARGGSKGVPGKNWRPLLGKPLILHSIEQARTTKLFDALCVSSDSPEVLNIAREAGVEVVVDRPKEMATDNAGKLDVIVHALKCAESELGITFDTAVDLDATAPVRLPADIELAVAILERSGASNLITACKARRSPYFKLVELKDGRIDLAKRMTGQKVVRRQDAPPCFDMNASIYVWQRDILLKQPSVFYDDTRLMVMPELRSHDIDCEFDWFIVEQILQSQDYRKEASYDAVD